MVGWWKKNFQLLGSELDDWSWKSGKWVSGKPFSPYSFNLRQKFTGVDLSWRVQQPAPEEEYGVAVQKAMYYTQRIAWITWYSHGGKDAWHRGSPRKYDVKREVKVEIWVPEEFEIDMLDLLDKACRTTVGVSLGEVSEWHGSDTHYEAYGESGERKQEEELSENERILAYATYINRTEGDRNIRGPFWMKR